MFDETELSNIKTMTKDQLETFKIGLISYVKGIEDATSISAESNKQAISIGQEKIAFVNIKIEEFDL